MLVLTLLVSALFAGNTTLILPGASWKYLDNGTDQGFAWYAPGFDDSSWPEGASELGYGDGGEATVVSYGPNASNKYITTYFRKSFNVTNPAILKSLLLGIRADDGAVIYLNGVEIARQNMPVGAINYTTLAPGNIGGHFENVYHHFTINPSLLVAGTNVIAVEMHQDDVTSSDLSFNLELLASTEGTFIARGDDWKYLDNGSDQGTVWKDVSFPDGSWVSGKSILGYNSTAASRLENTTVSYGPNASNKYITTYFRKTIFIADTSTFNQFQLNMYLDDGAVIYVNGVESNRINLPAGTITYTTTATTAVGTAAWASYPISKSLFMNGNNVIAVEVHQQAITSSDMNFEMELMESPPIPLVGGGCTNQNIGCFTSLAATCQSPGLFILPSTHTFQVLCQQGNPYIVGGGTMPTNNDFTAYVPINNSSEHGYLSINHENNPAGVSVLDLHYNPYTGLWIVDSSQAISYTDVVKSERNCSGGITPWGTVVVSEEAITGGDANADGYTDVGWHVEIDPVTKEIVDYNNDGLSDKCWALGRSTKENICFRADSITSYFGLDAGSTSYIYKFVANTPGNLSAGTLYVLRQNVYLGNTAYWVVVPNVTQADRNNSMSIATGLGATSFNKVEDVEIGPDGKIYFTSSNEGRVYRFSDSPSINDFEIYIDKLTYTVNTGSGTSSALFNNCDNLAFDPLDGNLWVNIDGNCNYFWMVRPGHTSLSPQIEIFARLPSGAESTGTTFSPDGRFMFVSIQHPSATGVTMTDIAGNVYTLNKATTIVVARNEDLGALAAIPFIDLGPDASICQNDTIVLDAGAGAASYLWNTGATTQTIFVVASGTYSVTVTGTNGRTNTDVANITVNPLPSAPVAASATYCFGDAVTPLNATGTNINWYDDASLTNFLGAGTSYNTGLVASGTYDFFATQTDLNGCISPATQVNLTIYSLPAAPVATNENICEGLTIPALSATGNDIEWYSDIALTNLVHNGNSFNTGNTLPGTYTYYVTQTDTNGCTNDSSTSSILAIYPEPSQPNVTGTTTYCAGDTIQPLTASGTGIDWYASPNYTTLVSSGNNFTPSIAATDTFYVSSTSLDGCVSNETTVIITIHSLPSAPVANDETACFGSIIPDLNSTGVGIEWYSDAGLTILEGTGNNLVTGNTAVGVYPYFLTQTDANGCTGPADNVTLTIYALPSAPIITGDLEYCIDENISSLNATGTNVTWYNDSLLSMIAHNGNSFTPSISTTTTYYVTDTENGCEGPSTPVQVVIHSLPVVNISGLSANYLLTASPVTVNGTPAGGSFSGPGISGNQFNPSTAGIGGPYMIIYQYTDPSTDCDNTDTTYVSVYSDAGVSMFDNGSSVNVFPNPSSNQITVTLQVTDAGSLDVELLDALGKTIRINTPSFVESGKFEFMINKNELQLAEGTYYLQIKLGGSTSSVKIVFVN